MNSSGDDKWKKQNGSRTCYKQKKSFAARKDEVKLIREKFPSKIPIIMERYEKEFILPTLDKTKFLVPLDITMSQFMNVLRSRLHLRSHQTLYLMVKNKTITSLTKTLSQTYVEYRDDDGFLYITYASQEAFG